MSSSLTDQIPPNRAARLRLRQFLPVYDTATQEQLGRMVDLSITGMMLIATHELPVGRIFEIEIRMPEGHVVPSFRISAESVWCRTAPTNAQHFGVGFRFAQMEEDALARLEALMQEAGTLH